MNGTTWRAIQEIIWSITNHVFGVFYKEFVWQSSSAHFKCACVTWQGRGQTKRVLSGMFIWVVLSFTCLGWGGRCVVPISRGLLIVDDSGWVNFMQYSYSATRSVHIQWHCVFVWSRWDPTCVSILFYNCWMGFCSQNGTCLHKLSEDEKHVRV